MKERCIVIPAIKKNAVIPDQLVKKLAGVTLVERAINTARGVLPGADIVVLTDSQEISLICERAGVGFRWNKDLRFTSLNIVAEMRGLLEELAASYEHAIILRASCPLITWVDVEDAWKKYCRSGADSLVTVKAVRQRLWNVRGEGLESLLSEDADRKGEQTLVVESRALIVLRLAPLREGAAQAPLRYGQGRIVPYFLNDRGIEIQGYQDWWICERLLQRRHVVFVVAGWPAIGMGHVFRALMLAHEITSHKITFVCTRESELAVENIARRDYKIVRQGPEELAETVLRLCPDLVVNDILNTTTAYMARLTTAGARCVNFEDEGPGAGWARLVVNALYEDQPGAQGLRCGPAYFCLRDEFLAAARNPFRPQVKTVLITFGGTDQNDCSRRVLDVIEPICRAYGITIRLVAGPGYAHKEAMEAHLAALANPLVEFTWATNVMSRMMEGADLAICSAGRTVYELAHMCVPGMVLAHHEREARHTFARPRNGFAFLGLMDRVSDAKIRNVFLAMLKAPRRQRFWNRQNALDFTANKARVVRLMLDLLAEAPPAPPAPAPQPEVRPCPPTAPTARSSPLSRPGWAPAACPSNLCSACATCPLLIGLSAACSAPPAWTVWWWPCPIPPWTASCWSTCSAGGCPAWPDRSRMCWPASASLPARPTPVWWCASARITPSSGARPWTAWWTSTAQAPGTTPITTFRATTSGPTAWGRRSSPATCWTNWTPRPASPPSANTA